MAEPTLVTWTPANMITIVLMGLLGFTVAGAIARVIQQRKQKAAPAGS